MKIPRLVLLLALTTPVALGDEPVRGVCVDGDGQRAFVVSAVIPKNVLEGGFAPEVDYAEDNGTARAVTWVASANARPAVTLIGRFKGREIVDITFPAAAGSGTPGRPFEPKVLAFRTAAAGTSPLLPFLVLSGGQVRWYEQVFTSDAARPFLLEVSTTSQGNGAMWANFTFGFGEGGARVDEVSSGGRGQRTKVTKFRPDGTVASTKELDGKQSR